jgi:hypothetical protein
MMTKQKSKGKPMQLNPNKVYVTRHGRYVWGLQYLSDGPYVWSGYIVDDPKDIGINDDEEVSYTADGKFLSDADGYNDPYDITKEYENPTYVQG